MSDPAASRNAETRIADAEAAPQPLVLSSAGMAFVGSISSSECCILADGHPSARVLASRLSVVSQNHLGKRRQVYQAIESQQLGLNYECPALI